MRVLAELSECVVCDRKTAERKERAREFMLSAQWRRMPKTDPEAPFRQDAAELQANQSKNKERNEVK